MQQANPSRTPVFIPAKRHFIVDVVPLKRARGPHMRPNGLDLSASGLLLPRDKEQFRLFGGKDDLYGGDVIPEYAGFSGVRETGLDRPGCRAPPM